MNPSLWSAFPDALLQRLFARLPLPKINQLRTLSKKWNRRISSEEGLEFMEACQEAHPRIFGMIIEGCDLGTISVRLFDIKSGWYSFQYLVDKEHVFTMCAGDGGLVCIVSAAIDKDLDHFPEYRLLPRLFVVVLNPLSRAFRFLVPPSPLNKVQPRMVQLVMDEDRKSYKVLVVGETSHPSGRGMCMTAMIFCSETNVWSTTEGFPDLIFGYQYDWKRSIAFDDDTDECLEEICLGPCAYDCAGRQLLKFDVERIPCGGVGVESYALVKDHLFVLHQEPFEGADRDGLHLYVVSEYLYQGQNCKPSWVMLKDHECRDFEYPPSGMRYRMELKACKGFLLLKAGKKVSRVHELTWLYDLSTTKWQKIPAVPDSHNGTINEDVSDSL